ncbi:hypothetical protein DPMN_033167, partial [Dreissena polymorpha]
MATGRRYIPLQVLVVRPLEGGDYRYVSYAGIFHFKFWWYGHWKEVIIAMYPMQVYSTSSSGGAATGRRYMPLQVLVVRPLEE